ncbi:hypothetical protein Fuma_03568 [Fuerstiella marisgermanici]|uniref:Uncharacterized protein n=1 Tax=Fuerstiella marisgermanici TaxID=1891926 RepID=A0A1P8WIQ6_9PLAN|nr:hypothetical protein Fuma_03568 [Fuerstiella marisgermanici]
MISPIVKANSEEGPVLLKPKYYPHITGLAVVFMTIAPLCLLLCLQDPADRELDALLAEDSSNIVLDATVHGSVDASANFDSVMANTASPPASVTVPPPSSPAVVAPARPPVVPPQADTRMAALPPVLNTPSTTSDSTATYLRPTTPQKQSDTDAVMAMAAADAVSSKHTGGGHVPTPTPERNIESPFDSDLPLPTYADVEDRTAPADVVASAKDVVMAEDDADEEPFVEPEISPPSAFDATGHLSMVGGVASNLGGSSKTVTSPAAPRSDDVGVRQGDEKSATSESRSRRRRSRRPDKTEVTPSQDAPVIESPRMINPFAPGLGEETPAEVVDIILQQPLESRPVSKIENLVAVTRTTGFPIALVRSGLPDDHWWVQQMVGARGNAFAGRVNFGNEDSIPGSVYHLVIVFLDSPDEVRRFRIAKQFRKLPEGIRRSREFTFVRR